MEFFSDIFIRYWKEVIVAVMLTITLPFIRMYVRRQRKRMLNFFKEREKLKQSLLEAEKKLKEAGELLESERKSREELERKLQAQTEETRKAQSNNEPTDSQAQYEIGNKYFADKKYAQAVYWYLKAAGQGHEGARNMMRYL